MTLGCSLRGALLLAFATLVPFVLSSNHHTSVRRFQEIRDLVEEEEGKDGAAAQEDSGLIDGIPIERVLDWFVLLGGCAGSLVASNVVMTAAHCLDREVERPATVQVGPSFRGPGGGGTFANVVRDSYILHPLYDRTPNRFDVGVFKLENEVPNKVITLNNDVSIPPDDGPVVAYGMGRFSDYDNDVSDIVMKVDQTYDPDCLDAGTNYLSEFMLCSRNNSAVCRGDSGGPLVYYQDTGTGYDVEIQIGIASFILDRFVCANGTGTDVWTRISFFEPWVKEQIAFLQTFEPPPLEEASGGCAQALASAYESLQSWVGVGIKAMSNFFGR